MSIGLFDMVLLAMFAISIHPVAMNLQQTFTSILYHRLTTKHPKPKEPALPDKENRMKQVVPKEQ